MNQQALRHSIQTHARFSFSRSGGPGGQNVNKVNTKVLLTISLSNLEGLSYPETELLRTKLSQRIDAEGCLFLSVEDERSQLKNREIAVSRIEELITRAVHIPKPRKKTKPKFGAIMDRLASKKNKSRIKSSRSFSPSED